MTVTAEQATENATATRRGIFVAIYVVAGMHLIAGIMLFSISGETTATASVSFLGLSVTAYTLGMRHAFDADHIAAIDNTTRSLVAQRRPSATVGMWFSLGHSTVVFALAVLVAIGAGFVGDLMADGSGAHQMLDLFGALISGVFLLAIGIITLIALVQSAGVWRRARLGEASDDELTNLQLTGPLSKLLRPLLASVNRPAKMYLVGFLFGLGFDTATETGLLIIAGTSAAIGMSWYAILLLPLLFASGMCLFDTADGIVMQRAYHWAFLRPIRKLYYNMTVTGLSVVVALGIGGIELIGVVHDKAHLNDPVTGWIASLGMDQAGYYIVGTFILVWLLALAAWWLRARRAGDRAVPTAEVR